MKARALLLVALFALACKEDQERMQHEQALKAELARMRVALATYKADHGKFPPSLEALVPHYLGAIPHDPMTKLPDWRVTTEETVQPSSDFQTATQDAPVSVVIDVRSNGQGTDRNGVPYANY